MEAESTAGTVADWATAGAAVVAVLALIVALLAWREARRSAVAAERSAVASEQSAEAAARSAAVEEAALDLAQRDAERRDVDREDEAGPQFERVTGTINKTVARAKLRVVGGPGRVVVDVEMLDIPWCCGITAGRGDGPAAQSIRFPPMEPGEVFELTAHLTGPVSRSTVLPLLITVESTDDPSRKWTRRVSVSLSYRPPARALSW